MQHETLETGKEPTLEARRLEGYLGMARTALWYLDYFAAETILHRAVHLAGGTGELLAIIDFVSREWDTRADRYYFPMKNGVLRAAYQKAQRVLLAAEPAMLGELAARG